MPAFDPSPRPPERGMAMLGPENLGAVPEGLVDRHQIREPLQHPAPQATRRRAVAAPVARRVRLRETKSAAIGSFPRLGSNQYGVFPDEASATKVARCGAPQLEACQVRGKPPSMGRAVSLLH